MNSNFAHLLCLSCYCYGETFMLLFHQKQYRTANEVSHHKSQVVVLLSFCPEKYYSCLKRTVFSCHVRASPTQGQEDTLTSNINLTWSLWTHLVLKNKPNKYILISKEGHLIHFCTRSGICSDNEYRIQEQHGIFLCVFFSHGSLQLFKSMHHSLEDPCRSTTLVWWHLHVMITVEREGLPHSWGNGGFSSQRLYLQRIRTQLNRYFSLASEYYWFAGRRKDTLRCSHLCARHMDTGWIRFVVIW